MGKPDGNHDLCVFDDGHMFYCEIAITILYNPDASFGRALIDYFFRHYCVIPSDLGSGGTPHCRIVILIPYCSSHCASRPSLNLIERLMISAGGISYFSFRISPIAMTVAWIIFIWT